MIRQMHHPEEIAEALDLIWETFLQFDAPDYCDEGVSAFRDFIRDEETVATLEFWGAHRDDELIGVIAANEHRKHICCFFVKSAYHRQGIGRRLFFPGGGLLPHFFGEKILKIHEIFLMI